jgi:paired amphipathic helix protein Sin3a
MVLPLIDREAINDRTNMRSILVPFIVLSGTVSAQLLVPLIRSASVPRPFDRDQAPLMEPVGPGPAVPPSGSSPAEPPPDSGGGVMLSDVMGKDRSINLFAGYVYVRKPT